MAACHGRGRVTVLAGGTLMDPASDDVGALKDVAFCDGKIIKVGAGLKAEYPDAVVFDATGCLVCPGLIDMHVHVYDAFTPLGLVADDTCLGRGVTTVVDAGSAGAATFPGLRKYIMAPARTRILALLHIAMEGLAWGGLAGEGKGGELDNLNQVRVEPAVLVIEANRDVIVGVKIRLTANIAADGASEATAYARAIEVARRTKLPLMTHHALSSVPLGGGEGLTCPGSLAAGDMYTHTYHGWKSTILGTDETKRVHEACLEARARGIVFDVGHGAGAFNWTVAELACNQCGFFPDVISTDLHTASVNGPAYDLPTVMTKFLFLGMELVEIIRSVTATPAKAIGWADRIGSLAVGREADVTVLRVEDVDLDLEDVHRQTRRIKKQFKTQAVWRAGIPAPLTQPDVFPNPKSGNPAHLKDPDLMHSDGCC